MASLRRHVGRAHSGSGSVHIGLFLELPDVFLIPDSLVSEPVGNLQTCGQNSQTAFKFSKKKIKKNLADLKLHYCGSHSSMSPTQVKFTTHPFHLSAAQ